MKTNLEPKKNVTISFKTSAEDKTELQQIANEKQISRSELIASLLHAYKYNYDFIGKSSPKEEELKSKLKTVERENRKLNLSLENAEHRIEIEQRSSRKLFKENLEMTKTIFNLKEELKTASSEINRLVEALNANHKPKEKDQSDKKMLYGSLGSLALSGLLLSLIPSLFKN
jgi:predicted RNase H-like nuclease (RuvC/YqgF family)